MRTRVCPGQHLSQYEKTPPKRVLVGGWASFEMSHRQTRGRWVIIPACLVSSRGFFPPSFHWLEATKPKYNTHTHVCTRTHKNTFAHRKKTQTCSMESANATFHVSNSPGRLSLSWKMKSYIFFLFTMSDGALAHYSHSDADTGFCFLFFLIKSKMHSLQPTSLSNLEWSSRRLFWENKNVYTAFLVIFSHSTSFTLQVCIHSFDIQTQASGRRTNQDIEME